MQATDASLLRAHAARRTTGLEPILEQYEQAFGELEEAGAGPAAIEAAFDPQIPLVLPVFEQSQLVFDDASSAAGGHIDVAFAVTRFGKATDVRVVAATADATRSAQKDLIRLIESSTFRPRIVDGRVADSTTVTVRYYPQALAEIAPEKR
jgi:hypothetical protein